MKTLSKTAVIALFASDQMGSSSQKGGNNDYPSNSFGVAAVKLEQSQSKPLTDHAPEDTELLQTSSKLTVKQKAALKNKTNAQWGFLKNIVNIDRFFASGPGSSSRAQVVSEPDDSAARVQSHRSDSVVPSSLKKSAPKLQARNSLSQVKSKTASRSAEETMEQEIAGGITDETATAAAEQALMEAANAQTTEQQDQTPDEKEKTTEENEAAQTGQESADQQVIEAAAAALAAEQNKQNNNGQADGEQKKETTSENGQAELEATVKAILAKKEQQEATVQSLAQAEKKVDPKPASVQGQTLPQHTEAEKKLAETDMSMLKSKAEKESHAEQVREEGLKQIMVNQNSNKEVDLEIEAPGAANKVAEEGASIVTSQEEFSKDIKELAAARAKPENAIGKGGFKIDFKNPQEYEDTMRVVIFNDVSGKLDEAAIKEEKFSTKDPGQAKAASMAMAMTLQTEAGATIVDDQPGKESIIQNLNSDSSKKLSQIASGFAVRHAFVQKMAPGDKQFHTVTWDEAKNVNHMATFQSRSEAEAKFQAAGEVPKILISGETGDVLLANGKENMVDQSLGMFYTQRYQGKYYGMP